MGADPQPALSRSDLNRVGPASVAVASLVATAVVATVAACNIHEIGHAVVATMLGWEVDRIELCLPTGGSVVYSHVGSWTGNLQGYAGGFIAAIVLLVAYLFIFARRAMPLAGVGWWFAGLGLVLPIGPQVAIGVLEGAVGPGEDYTQKYGGLIPLLVVVGYITAAVAYSWRWRAVWRR